MTSLQTALPRMLMSKRPIAAWMSFEKAEIHLVVVPQGPKAMIEITNIVVAVERQGTFNRAIAAIREMSGLPIYLTSVRADFATHLVRQHNWEITRSCNLRLH